MRLFETLLFLLCMTDAFARFRFAGRQPIWTSAIPLISFFFAIIHIAGEGVRWQMIPIYLVVLSTFTISLVRTFQTGVIAIGGERLSRSVACLIILCAIVSLTAGTALPVFELDPPTGHYVVGTVDTELGTSGIRVRIHYPSDKARGDRATYASGNFEEHRAYLALQYGFPASLLSHLSLVRTWSFPAARPSGELPRFRVLITCPEPNRPATHATIIAEDLASRGFVVITPTAVDSAFDSVENGTDRDAVLAEEIITRLESYDPGKEAGWLADRLDFGSVGIYGLGKAGETAMEACIDGSFKAGASLGITPATNKPTVPFLYLSPEGYQSSPQNVNATTYSISLVGAMIDNFGDDAFVSPLMPAFGDFGSIDAYKTSRITSAYLGAFFNKHLTRGTVEPLLDDPADAYPEAVLTIHHPEE